MPYIAEDNRQEHAELLQSLDKLYYMHPGELNFLITSILKKYIDLNGITYTSFNDLVGVLECAKLELYRRRIAPYENRKLARNGDVY